MKVTKIVPLQTKKKVAAYARVSTLIKEQEESFETQVLYYSNLINKNKHWQFVKVYSDHGKSGLSVSKRPGFMEMFNDAMNNKIDLILVKSISRFGRNSLEAQDYIHTLKEKGVEVYFERENISSLDPQTGLLFNFLSAVAQEESKSISLNTRWAYEKLAKQGIRHLGSNRVLGYDEINGTLIPNKDATIVRYIFEQYANNASMKQIAINLKTNNFKTLRGKNTLSTSTISYILHNEIYIGDRRIQKKPPTSPLSKKPDYSKEYTSYYVFNSHQPIISRELWNKVQFILNTKAPTKK